MAKLARLILNTVHVAGYRRWYNTAGIPVPDIEDVMCFIFMGTDEITIQWDMVAQQGVSHNALTKSKIFF